MLSFLKELKRKRELRNLQVSFYFEVEKNWESWHVMYQRNVMDKFSLDAWLRIKDQPSIQLKPDFVEYAVVLKNYNDLMDSFKAFEKWYAADLKNKTTENAKVLHEKKNAVSEKFKEMKDMVKGIKIEAENELKNFKVNR
ncbi:MAG: hypothetical protein A2Z88_08205 [Omnitrophica WOR_2 bacterium GWA2_47_8]|nr:MAG: hypothetical protein A2Z88_08205 [Omnitrophica WOR_2 bacterium GWA2_47_8]